MFYLYKQAIKVSSWEMDTSKKNRPCVQDRFVLFFLGWELSFFLTRIRLSLDDFDGLGVG